jgi:hypothetical protein
MNVVIVGSKYRNIETDRGLVDELLEKCIKTYGSCLFFTIRQTEGVGRMIFEACSKKDHLERYVYQFADINVRLFAKNLSNTEASVVYLARNAFLYEVGDVFFLLADEERKSAVEELFSKRVEPSGRPFKIFLPGEPIGELV